MTFWNDEPTPDTTSAASQAPHPDEVVETSTDETTGPVRGLTATFAAMALSTVRRIRKGNPRTGEPRAAARWLARWAPLLALGAVVLVVFAGSLLPSRTIEDVPEPTPTGIVGGNPTPTLTPSPEPTDVLPTPSRVTPTLPQGPSGDQDGAVASEQAQAAAEAALTSFYYTDTNESRAQRRERLQGLFAPGSTFPDAEPVFAVDDAQNLIGEAEVNAIEVIDNTDTTAAFVLTFMWGVAEWNPGGTTHVQGGYRSLEVYVEYIDGVWMTTDIRSTNKDDQ